MCLLINPKRFMTTNKIKWKRSYHARNERKYRTAFYNTFITFEVTSSIKIEAKTFLNEDISINLAHMMS